MGQQRFTGDGNEPAQLSWTFRHRALEDGIAAVDARTAHWSKNRFTSILTALSLGMLAKGCSLEKVYLVLDCIRENAPM
jgi:hypothetical protein